MKSSKEKSRILYLDLAKALAILFMIMQHCMIIHERSAGEGESILANIFVLLGTAPAAPVFMLVMGIFLMSSGSSFQKNIFRGIKLILLGYLLNLLRFTIPLLITGAAGFQYTAGETPLSMFLSIDILQLAGLSMIVGSLFKKTINKKVFPVIILFILLVSPFLWSQFGNSSLFSILWGNAKNVYFPFFPWFIYPLLGMYMSKYLLDIQKINKNLKKISLIGIVTIVLGILFFDFFPIGDYHRSGAAIHSLIIGFIFLWLPICFRLANKFKEGKIVKVFSFWSKNVTAVYFIQWVLFGGSILFFDANKQNAYVAAIIGLLVLILTHFIVKSRILKKFFSWF